MPQMLLVPDIYSPPNDSPLVRILSYSAGRQSHAIALLVLKGLLPRPDLVVTADPGNEHIDTYRFRDDMFSRLENAGIPTVIADGPKMLEDLQDRKRNGKSRLDNPPLWTANGGQLTQKCTREYKVRPMDRVVLAFAYKQHGKKLPDCSIEKWIGFCWDERHRIKPLHKQDRRFQARYPLIDMQWTRDRVIQFYRDIGEEMPPPSVCCHCFANSPATFKRIMETDPTGWEKAKQYDAECRDLKQFGVNEQCYCSATLVPLDELERTGFVVDGCDVSEQSCDDGYCFL